MKELKKAKKNIGIWEITKPEDKELWRLNTAYHIIQTHKESCERFLEFLESWEVEEYILGRGEKQINPLWEWLNNKITDLKNVIKLYEKAGIK